jgi:hypothetical protein
VADQRPADREPVVGSHSRSRRCRRGAEEFDSLGREEFLAKYGFGEARSYFLVRDGKAYDSKAVVGAAQRWTASASCSG